MNPLHWLFLLFLVIPLIEIYLLILVGGLIGPAATVVMVVLTAVIGVYLLRLQGFSTLQRVRGSLAQGQVPAAEMLEGVVLVLAGALLLTPGFFTDTLGFLALMPALRRPAVRWFMSRIDVAGIAATPPASESARTIEGEFRRDDD